MALGAAAIASLAEFRPEDAALVVRKDAPHIAVCETRVNCVAVRAADLVEAAARREVEAGDSHECC